MHKRSKIVHLITDLDVGGAETMLLRLLSHLDREHFDAHVISLIPSGPIGERIAALGIPVMSLGLRPGRVDLVGLFRLVGLLRKIRPHILQTWLYHADLLGLLAGRISGVPRVLWNIRSADMDMSSYHPLSGITRKVCASLSFWPDAVVINSHAGQAFHTQIGYHPKQWVLIPNGVSTENFKPDSSASQNVRQEFRIEQDTSLAGSFSRYDATKDFPNLLAAAAYLREQGANFHLLLAGDKIDAENTELVGMIKNYKLEEIVHLLGRRDDIPRLAAALDIYVSASYTEGFPNVLAEAMACGVPCVATNAGDAAAIIDGTGFVVPIRDPQALASAWGRMIRLPVETRRAMQQSARERIKDSFSIEAISKNYEKLYEELLAH